MRSEHCSICSGVGFWMVLACLAHRIHAMHPGIVEMNKAVATPGLLCDRRLPAPRSTGQKDQPPHGGGWGLPGFTHPLTGILT